MPAKQHPVPQHISSYEFRLVGEMTLKQFGYLAGGAVLVLIFYSLPIPGFFKWPLVTFFGLMSFGLAFMPLNERPLSTWIIAFFKAIVSPTLFVWKKTAQKPEIFTTRVKKTPSTKIPSAPPDRAKLTEYLSALPEEKVAPVRVEKEEQAFLQQINQLFQTAATPVIPQTIRPTFWAPVPHPQPPKKIKPKLKIPLETKPVKPEKRVVVKPQPETPSSEPKKTIFVSYKPPGPNPQAVSAKAAPHLPMPEPPARPNVIAGMVMDKNGEIIEDAIIEIRNNQGLPVRALRTNKLGQFAIVTPLANDFYEIETEKEDYDFDIIKFKAMGDIIQPIEIRAK